MISSPSMVGSNQCQRRQHGGAPRAEFSRRFHPRHKEQAEAWVLTTLGPLDLTHGDMGPEFCLQEVAYLVVQVLMVFASSSAPGGLPALWGLPAMWGSP